MFLFCFCPQCDMPHYCPWFFRFVLMDVLVTTDVGLQLRTLGRVSEIWNCRSSQFMGTLILLLWTWGKVSSCNGGRGLDKLLYSFIFIIVGMIDTYGISV